MGRLTPMETSSGDEFGAASRVFSLDAKRQERVGEPAEQGLEVNVIFTDPLGTQAALQMAEALAQKLGAHIKLLMPHEVPYTLPLTKPAVAVGFLEGQLRKLACTTHLQVTAHVCLCRDKRWTLDFLLRPNSLTAVGGKKRWWPTAAQKIARDLEKKGHHVIFAELR